MTVAVGGWPSTAPTQSAANTTAIQPKGNPVKSTSWAGAEIGYQLALRTPVCTRLRNARMLGDDQGDPFCKRQDFF
ncbi:MAG: hypothetical protein ABSE39_03815 [Candidatus Bathyarchaeia archaeon]